MEIVTQEAINQFKALMDQVEEPLKKTYQNIHQGYQTETLVRYLKAREGNVAEAYKMLVVCLKWRVQNDIDSILEISRDSQLIGMSGFSRGIFFGLPVFAIGVGLSSFGNVSVNYYVQSHIQINEYRDRVILYGRPVTTCVKVLDMTGLKLSALSQLKVKLPALEACLHGCILTFLAVVKPLLEERTRKKCKYCRNIMDLASLPHFCKHEVSRSSRHPGSDIENCFSLDHPFHQQLYNYIKQQAIANESAVLIKQGSFHVDLPETDTEGADIAKTIESELNKFGNGKELIL
ncbi:hypothetical protein K2173_011051 [Erythroxylum novogranatense]|uniref:CRAL/TRIO N-terminal domain-containing protein n=1 Tax=Erythroxylum novogranatense TaxID=1862640 RepID=A0AAV8T0D1_9ROSI|nr:hypothetical protein K2173_011051 [Erythroxylum novogranatense]